MIAGAHVLIYSADPEADRAFFRDVLGFASVDVGGGWLIFALPPAEAAFHPADGASSAVAHGGRGLLNSALYLMCDDLNASINFLKSKNVSCTEVVDAGWGIKTSIRLPSGGEIGLYQPRHASPLHLPNHQHA